MTRAGNVALAAALLAGSLAGTSQASAAGLHTDHASPTVRVTNGNPSGPGSYAQAVEDANDNDRIRRIVFNAGLTVAVTDCKKAMLLTRHCVNGSLKGCNSIRTVKNSVRLSSHPFRFQSPPLPFQSPPLPFQSPPLNL